MKITFRTELLDIASYVFLTEAALRTTLTIDDDILVSAKALAVMERKTVGTVISSLARQALRSTLPGRSAGSRNGIPLLPMRPGSPSVTPELIRQFLEELP
jgi:hypothetical protein